MTKTSYPDVAHFISRYYIPHDIMHLTPPSDVIIIKVARFSEKSCQDSNTVSWLLFWLYFSSVSRLAVQFVSDVKYCRKVFGITAI